MLSRKYAWIASAVAWPSATCSWPMPASVQPTTLRVMSPHAPEVVSPTSSSRANSSGISSSFSQWFWKHWRVVQSMIPRAYSSVMSAITSAWSAVSTPCTTFVRSMKWPSFVLCAYSPYHLSRMRSSSSRDSQPTSAARISAG